MAATKIFEHGSLAASAAASPEVLACPFDRRLVENVRPPEWENPQAREKYHLVVIGGGTGGLVTAAIAAGLGASVALVERKLLGGDCLNVGCVPSKAVIRAARAWKAADEAHERFGGRPTSGDGDFARAMERMRRIRANLSGHDSAARFAELGVDVFLGEATFTGEDTVAVGGQTLRFRRAVVATGSHPAVPPIHGLQEAGYLTNETVFSLTELPRRLVVIGGGPIGCELAQAFAQFGSRVTVIEAADRILSKDDPEAARVVEQSLRRDGVEFLCGATVTRVERPGDERIVHFTENGGTESIVSDQILVAVGRTLERRGARPRGRGRAPRWQEGDRGGRKAANLKPPRLRCRRHRFALPVHARGRRAGAAGRAQRALLRPRQGERPVDPLVHLHQSGARARRHLRRRGA